MKSQYQYLITYCYDNIIGEARVTVDRAIKSFTDIKDIQEYLEEKNGNVKGLIIMNYTLIRKFDKKRKFI